MAIYKKGENWFIDYRVQGRRIREKAGPSRTVAKQVLAKRKAQILEENFFPKRKKRLNPKAPLRTKVRKLKVGMTMMTTMTTMMMRMRKKNRVVPSY